MPEHAIYPDRKWNIDLDQRVKVSNAELRYAVLRSVACIHGTSIADSLITPLPFYLRPRRGLTLRLKPGPRH